MKLKITLLFLILFSLTELLKDTSEIKILVPNYEKHLILKQKITPSLSTINIELKLHTKDLEKKLSLELPHSHKLRYKNSKKKSFTWIKAKITREDNIKIEVKKNTLMIEFTLNIKGKIKYKKCNKINLLICSKNCCYSAKSKFSVKATLKAYIDVGVTKLWNLNTKKINLSVHIDKASTSIYGLKIPIRKILQKEINKNSKKINSGIEKAINTISIKKEMEEVWRKMHITQQINQQNIWFHFTPKDIAFSSTYETNNTLCLSPCIIGEGLILTHKSDTQKYIKTPLPNLNNKRKKNNKFAIKLPINLNYTTLSKMILKKLDENKITKNGFQIQVNDIKFIPSGKEIIIIIDFHSHFKINFFDTKGKIVFRGEPDYHLKKHQLSIKNLKYHLDINEEIVSLSSFLWHEHFKNEIEKILVHDISQTDAYIHQYKTIINQKLNELNITNEIKLNAQMDTLKLEKLYLTHSDIVIILTMLGDMNLSYTPQKEK